MIISEDFSNSYLQVYNNKINDANLTKELRYIRKRIRKELLKQNELIKSGSKTRINIDYEIFIDTTTNKLFLEFYNNNIFSSVRYYENLSQNRICVIDSINIPTNKINNNKLEHLYPDGFVELLQISLEKYNEDYFNDNYNDTLLLDDLNDEAFDHKVTRILATIYITTLTDEQIDRYCNIVHTSLYNINYDDTYLNIRYLRYLNRDNRLKLFKSVFANDYYFSEIYICRMIRMMNSLGILRDFESVFNIDYNNISIDIIIEMINTYPLKIDKAVIIDINDVYNSFDFLRLYNSFNNMSIKINNSVIKLTDNNFKTYINNFNKLRD